jgi:uncharacterized protein YegP (UPF0339 family)
MMGEANSADQYRPKSTWKFTSNERSKIMAAKFELYRSSNGEYRWRLRATNGQVMATGGEGYSSKAAAQGGIESVKRVAGSALIEDA